MKVWAFFSFAAGPSMPQKFRGLLEFLGRAMGHSPYPSLRSMGLFTCSLKPQLAQSQQRSSVSICFDGPLVSVCEKYYALIYYKRKTQYNG
jgi:hypothetical protein